MAEQGNTPVHMNSAKTNGNLPSTDFRESIPESADEKPHLRDYIEVLIRRKWLVIAMLFLTFISTFIFSLAAQKQYVASGTIQVSPESYKVTKFEDVVDQRVRTEEFVTTQVTLLKSKALAQRVIDALDLRNHPEIVGDDAATPGPVARLKTYIGSFIKKSENESSERLPMESVIEEKRIIDFIQENLKVTPQRDSMIINISFMSPSRQLSQSIVNELMAQNVDWKMDQNVESSAKAREYLMKQIDRAKINLEKAEEQQSRFARQAGIVSMDSRINSIYRQLEDINASLGQAEAELIVRQTAYEQALEDGVESLPQILNSKLINDLKTEYAKLRSEYENQIVTFHEDYPDVRTLKSRMESIEAQIAVESMKIFNSIKHDYLALKRRVESFEQKMAEKKQQAMELNEQAIQYNIMVREVETNKAIYLSLLERAKEIESMAGISPANIQVVDQAGLPIFPDKPNVRRNLLLAIVLGMVNGIGMVFLIEYFTDTITNPDQISERFQIAILGMIPLEKEASGNRLERIFVNEPHAAMSEAFRTTKVSIQLSGSGSNAKCIAVTSTAPGEGKTTIAANLSQAFAGNGEKVLLIDADLRKPRLHKVFPTASAVNNGNGLSTFLAGVIDSGFIAKTSIENLYLIPSGMIPPNPVELLAANRFSQLLKKAVERFDRIIIDAPPHHGFADILVLSRQVGGVILVSAMGETTRDGVRHFKKAMRNVQGNVLGCIVNKVNFHQRFGYGSYYKYYGAYHSPYGKSNGCHSSKKLEA